MKTNLYTYPFFVATLLWLGTMGEARALFKVCNQTSEEVSVAIGYEEDRLTVTEGWWLIKPQACQVLIEGELALDHYYLYGIDKKGSEWTGKHELCVDLVKFKVQGISECEKHTFQAVGFIRHDRRGLTSHTIQLVDDEAKSAAISGEKPKAIKSSTQ